MKKFIALLFITGISLTGFSQVKMAEVDEYPIFGSCDANTALERCFAHNMLNHVKEHIKYPALLQDNGITGTVYVGFVIEEDGSFNKVKIMNKADKLFKKEVLRVVLSLPDCKKPAMKNGKAVAVEYALPIKFAL